MIALFFSLAVFVVMTSATEAAAVTPSPAAAARPTPVRPTSAAAETQLRTVAALGSVPGAEVQSSVTHQVFDHVAGHVDVNLLFGSTFPYAVSSLAASEVAMDGGRGGPCDMFVHRGSADVAAAFKWKRYCTKGGLGETPLERQTVRGYRAGALCDLDGDARCTIADVFETGAVTTPYNASDAYFGTDRPAGSPLPGTRCVGSSAVPPSVSDEACLQNVHLRLTPKGWCDLNARFTLSVGVVCRDDLRGDGSHPRRSLVTDVRGAPHLVVGNEPLRDGGGSVRFCSTPAGTQHSVTFTLASSDFCPRGGPPPPAQDTPDAGADGASQPASGEQSTSTSAGGSPSFWTPSGIAAVGAASAVVLASVGVCVYAQRDRPRARPAPSPPRRPPVRRATAASTIEYNDSLVCQS